MKSVGVALAVAALLAACGGGRSTWDMEECERRVQWEDVAEQYGEGAISIYVSEFCWLRAAPDRPAGPEEQRHGYVQIIWDGEVREIADWTQWPEDES